ncbi:AraC family transcriptional regulator ligand-binding domain-containing protein [Chitinophaga sp. 22321]|uniref:AraC family transcriptional regulator ligand-binding domain-containing protein n=1 Tax=Chitinophaga hostae TaxID=2831022 RepID=A0ABS5J691_9BACT|nr:AraC family transcriptional regulator [Chitinophaga hostae]MBS0030736.1 AraC family transcriptional regulator ligand-binding domain-containing protein [Chitinophaga hostae]
MKANSISPYWVAMPVMRNLIMLGARNEQEVAAICKAANIHPDDLNNIEMKVSLECNIAIMEALLQISGDANIGLHLGEKAAPPIIGQAGHLQQSSSDVLTAFKKTVYFTRTFTALYDFIYEEKEDEVLLYFEPVQLWNDIAPESARHGVDIPFAAILNFIRVLSGRVVYPIRVLYRFSKVNDTSEHEKIFRRKPLFNKNCNCIVFKKSDLEVPILGYNPQLNEIIENLLHEKLRTANEGVRLTAKVKEAILGNYHYDFPQLETIALALNMTPRTLQRKLQEENTTYRELSDTIKFELASVLLKHNELSVAEIAYKLGYTEPGTFRKAFKQWSGNTPLDYRDKA